MIYDWKRIKKEYRKLNIPSEYWTPVHIDMNAQAHIMNISERETGKTTQWLLLALTLNKLYGTTFSYLRQFKTQIAPKTNGRIFATIRQNGYIEKITNGKYKDVFLWGGVWRYCNRDENNKVIEQSEIIGYTMSVDQWDIYKSNFSDTKCDIVIYDEFISNRYAESEFEHFMDILSTIGRQREEFYIILLGNTMNRHNMYFQEYGITKNIMNMRAGERKIITSGMVRIYFELIGEHDVKRISVKDRIKQWRFGFNNPKLSAITGQYTWNFKNYPHPNESIDVKKDLILYEFIIKLDTECVKGALMMHDRVVYILFKPYQWTNYRDDLRVYDLDTNTFNIYKRFAMGHDKLDTRIWNIIYNTNRVFFATNETGMIVSEYIERCRTAKII